MRDHVTRKQFLLEFFGVLGRELGDPIQHFTNNPMEIFAFVEACTKNKKPAFISVQPRFRHHNPRKQFGIYGIEKIFYDFDYGRKSDKLTSNQIAKHRIKMEREIKIFLHHLTKDGIIPLVVKTRKGYHVYVYFDRIYEIDEDENFWRSVYKFLYERFTKSNRCRYKYVDTTSDMDISRLCRIPTSIHQKNGKECIVLDVNLKPTKLRSIEYFKMYGLRRGDLVRAVEWVRVNEEKRKKEVAIRESERKENWQGEHGYTGEIRPCFKKRMDVGEMYHQQRLALLIEAFYFGVKTRQAMVDFFNWLNDWDGNNPSGKCWMQVNWFFDSNVKEDRYGEPKCRVKPYRCDTIREKGWCLGEECPIYRIQKERGKISKT